MGPQIPSSSSDYTASSARLNEDVLYHIMSFLVRPRDVLAAMQTCYALYRLGLPLLLQNVRLQTAAQYNVLEAFLEQHPLRYQSIRAVTFSFSSGFDQFAERFVGFLRKLRQLQDLNLMWLPTTHYEGRLVNQITQQVSSMSSLRRLSILGDIPPHNVVQLFTHVQSESPLTELDIGYFYYTIQPLAFLAPLKLHLEKLTIHANPGGISFTDLEELPSAETKFPRVRSLSFDCTGSDFAKVGLLPRIFPYVRDFAIRGIHLPPDQVALTALRSANRAQQADLRWDTLERLEGTVRSVYAAGLTSRAKHLRLNLSSRVDVGVAECAKAVIRDAKPHSLQVDVQANSVRVLRDLPAMLEPVHECLDRLEIGLYLDSDGVVSAANGDITHELLSSIAKCTSLRSLHLSLLETRQLSDKDSGFYLPQWMVDRFKLIDVDRLIRLSMECMPSLQDVRVEALDRLVAYTRASIQVR
ncbi:hypothetical protein PHLGIDRAFT_126143 [Phlebiopsis gigantea 11061_1 CR5-6]|uniref:F-box domain-containing protein n=1 Tax=Phlebiopsis gigantea (strain 11061_1 CR5-6) TaxID=745531 RepID=A0A0C3PR99_PHLG1|nr:hypothetical protein PHLGIDRAFT_126143 [Phlebiopsis gigantea 11061_1 CR5-6]